MGTTVSTEEGAGGGIVPTITATSSGGASTVKSRDDGTNSLVSTVASSENQKKKRSSSKQKKNRKGPVGSAVGIGMGAVQDDDINVNLAMADLMAYLQLVAANSQDLPLTRRDDPELGKTVCTLSSLDYSKRAEAFLPCDVRVIGGSFTKYGRIRELPSSEVSSMTVVSAVFAFSVQKQCLYYCKRGLDGKILLSHHNCFCQMKLNSAGVHAGRWRSGTRPIDRWSLLECIAQGALRCRERSRRRHGAERVCQP